MTPVVGHIFQTRVRWAYPFCHCDCSQWNSPLFGEAFSFQHSRSSLEFWTCLPFFVSLYCLVTSKFLGLLVSVAFTCMPLHEPWDFYWFSVHPPSSLISLLWGLLSNRDVLVFDDRAFLQLSSSCRRIHPWFTISQEPFVHIELLRHDIPLILGVLISRYQYHLLQ